MTPFRREFHLTGTMADLPRIGEFIEEIQSLERKTPLSDDQKELFIEKQ